MVVFFPQVLWEQRGRRRFLQLHPHPLPLFQLSHGQTAGWGSKDKGTLKVFVCLGTKYITWKHFIIVFIYFFKPKSHLSSFTMELKCSWSDFMKILFWFLVSIFLLLLFNNCSNPAVKNVLHCCTQVMEEAVQINCKIMWALCWRARWGEEKAQFKSLFD